MDRSDAVPPGDPPTSTPPAAEPAPATSTPTAGPAQATAAAADDDPLTEVLVAWAAAIGLVYGLWQLVRWGSLDETVEQMVIPLIWIGIPVGAHLWRGRSLDAEGLTVRRPLRSLGFVALYAAFFLPLYGAGFAVWQRSHPMVPPAPWRLPSLDIALTALAGGFVYAGLPEEAFFRGFAQPRLSALYAGGKARRFLGLIPISRGTIAAAALFALTHAAFLPEPFSLAGAERLTTFFPGLLFGALREETGDIFAPAVFHALCNAFLYTMQHGYLT